MELQTGFKAEKEKTLVQVPENKYKYFPTQDPNTWRLLNDNTTNRGPIQHTTRHDTNWYPQQTNRED
jgi:hypothetical protein